MTERSGPAVGLLEVLLLRTPDVVSTLAFYRDVLGAAVIEDAPPHWARVRLGNVDLGLHEGEAAEGGWEPGFRVRDIAAFRAHLEAVGATITQPYHDIPGGVKLGFADPAGNRLAAYQYGTSEAELRG